MYKSEEFFNKFKSIIKKNGKYCGNIIDGEYEDCPFADCDCSGCNWCDLFEKMYEIEDVCDKRVDLRKHLENDDDFWNTDEESRLKRVNFCIKYFGE
jgi:hypothetical protein